MKKKWRFLITNDDGVHAPGIAVLADVAKKLAPKADVWVIAPQTEQSGAAQSITTHTPLRVHELEKRRYAVSGTPADCVVVGMQEIMKNHPPDFVLSGINSGLNIGNDINLSGTMGAAFTSLMYGIPSIAVSQKRVKHRHVRWETSQSLLPEILAQLLKQGWEDHHCLSINIPDLLPDEINGCRWTRPAQGSMPPFSMKQVTDLHDKKCFWSYPSHDPETKISADSDAAALAKGFISINSLALIRHFVVPKGKAPTICRTKAQKTVSKGKH